MAYSRWRAGSSAKYFGSSGRSMLLVLLMHWKKENKRKISTKLGKQKDSLLTRGGEAPDGPVASSRRWPASAAKYFARSGRAQW